MSAAVETDSVSFRDNLLFQFDAVVDRIDCGFQQMQQLSSFLKKRAQIEEDYARKLIKLSDAELSRMDTDVSGPSQRTACAIRTILSETRRLGTVHEATAGQMMSRLVNPLTTTRKALKKRKDLTATDATAAQRKLDDTLALVQRNKNRYHEACRLAYTDMSSYRKASQDPSTKPSVAMKLGDRMKKSKETVAQHEEEYHRALTSVNMLQETHWQATMPCHMDTLESLEKERVEMVSGTIQTFVEMTVALGEQIARAADDISAAVLCTDPLQEEVRSFVVATRSGQIIPGVVPFEPGVDYSATGRKMSAPGGAAVAGAGAAAAGAGLLVVGAGAEHAGRDRRRSSADLHSGDSSGDRGEDDTRFRVASFGGVAAMSLQDFIAQQQSLIDARELARREQILPHEVDFGILHMMWTPPPAGV